MTNIKELNLVVKIFNDEVKIKREYNKSILNCILRYNYEKLYIKNMVTLVFNMDILYSDIDKTIPLIKEQEYVKKEEVEMVEESFKYQCIISVYRMIFFGKGLLDFNNLVRGKVSDMGINKSNLQIKDYYENSNN